MGGTRVSAVPDSRYPIIGHLLELLPDNIMATFERNRRKYGNIVDVYIFNGKYVD